jgi:nucleotide sugar dehydrogenase
MRDTDTGAGQMSGQGLDGSRAVVVGLGKIGLPLAVQYAEHGLHVYGCDRNPAVVDTVNSGASHVHEELGLEERVARLVRTELLTATVDTTAAVREAAVVVVIVPVVVDEHHAVDFAGITAATEAVGRGLQRGTLVIYETTLPVGTTAGRLRAVLEEASGLIAGQDFDLAYSPERVSSGSIFRDLAAYPKVVGGITEQSTAAAAAFYSAVLDAPIMRMQSIDEAEFVKLAETTYRDVNIALANEFAQFADAHGLDAAAAIAAANTQPYSHIHSPGVGVGGHCIPVYPYFLLHGDDGHLTLPRHARAINDGMADYAAERVEQEIGSLRDQTVLVLGVAYRGDVRETAFTSARLLQQALRARGARVLADDPLFSDDELMALDYTPLHADQCAAVRAIVVQAGHRAYQSLDFTQFSSCQVVLDGRQALERARIESLGIRYLTIGDGQAATSARAHRELQYRQG